MSSIRNPSARRTLPAVLLVLLLAGMSVPGLAVGHLATPAANPAPATPHPATPGAHATPGTPTAATPAAVGTPSLPLDCDGPCLVRFATDADLDAALSRTGMRASYQTSTATWVGGSPEDLGLLVADVSPAMVIDDAPSLNLYAITDGAGRPNQDLIEASGTVIDTDGLTSIVAMPTVPAYVWDFIANGLIVEKLTPYVPPGTPRLSGEPTGNRPPVADAVTSLVNADATEITRTLTDLGSAGARPGEPGSRYFALPGNELAAEYLFLRFAAYGLDVWYEDYVASNGMLSLNVVAELPGRVDGPIWAGFAHFDTIAEDTPGNDIAPGALDNGTGIAVLLETARVLSAYELTYPVRLVALNGEEVGLQGSRAFGDQAIRDGTPYGGGINIDSVGTARGYRVLYVNASPSSAFVQDVLLTVYDEVGFQLNLAARQNPAIVSDEVPLTNAGIPTILVASMLYGDPLINCSCDTIDGVDIDYTRATARLVLLTLAVLARE